MAYKVRIEQGYNTIKVEYTDIQNAIDLFQMLEGRKGITVYLISENKEEDD